MRLLPNHNNTFSLLQEGQFLLNHWKEELIISPQIQMCRSNAVIDLETVPGIKLKESQMIPRFNPVNKSHYRNPRIRFRYDEHEYMF